MSRIAWFSPLPPAQTAVASMSAALLPVLAASGTVDAYTDTPAAPVPGVIVRDAHEFARQHVIDPYEAVVYHVADEPSNAFVRASLEEVPGLIVLHTLHLHDSRREGLLGTHRDAAYRRELEAAHGTEAAPVASSLPLSDVPFRPVVWPLRRAVLTRARAVAVFDEGAAEIIRGETAGVPVVVVSTAVSPPSLPTRAEARARLGLPAHAFLFASMEAVGWEPRREAVLALFGKMAARYPRVRLVLPTTDRDPIARGAAGHEPQGEAAIGTTDAPAGIIYLRAATDDDRWALRVAADIGLQIDWPGGAHDAPHAHAAWLAAGTPLLALDRGPTSRWPLLNPQSWQPFASAIPGVAPPRPVGVGVPLDDELHSLGRSIERLVQDDDLRAALAEGAKAWAQMELTPALAAERYRAAIEAMLALRPSPANGPRPPAA